MRGLKSLLVQRYDHHTKTWVAFPGTKACKYCADTNVLLPSHPGLLRIDVTQQFVAKSDGYVVLGSTVYKGQKLKQRIIVSTPSVSNPKNLSPIYIDSRMKGRHATGHFTEGDIILDLDGQRCSWGAP